MSARALLAGGLAAGVAAALGLRPLAHGVPGTTVAVFWATVLGQVVVPGVLLSRAARLHRAGDPWLALGQGATLGLAIQGLALLAGRALGLPWLPASVAIGTVAASLALRGRSLAEPPAGAAPAPAATLAVVLGAVLLQPLWSPARLGEPVPFDLLFHAGTAAELRHRWPMEDPRVAGVPLHYHVLSFALPVEAADGAGAPVADTLLGLAPLLWVSFLALQLANAARTLFGDGRAGAIGAAIALFHTDPGGLLGLGPGAFNSHLATGIYGSPTTVCGLLLLAGLVIGLERWVEDGGRGRLAACALLSAAASGTKTTVMPVVLCGLALATVVAYRRGAASHPGRWAAALVATAAAAAPLTLWQTAGPGWYSTMVRPALAAAFASSGFAAAAARRLSPDAHALLGVPVFLAWIAGFLGLAGVGAAVWLARREDDVRVVHVWAAGAVAAGLGASLLLDDPGLSQLFFAYNAHVVLCLFAGAAVAGLATGGWSPARVAAAVLLAVSALPSADHLARALPVALRGDVASAAAPATPSDWEYLEGLAWLRARATRDAVVFADNPSLALSALGEVRMFLDNPAYTAPAREVSRSVDPWPDRTALQERLLRRPGRAEIAEARRAVGPGPRLLVVADAVPTHIEAGYVLVQPRPVPRRRLFPPSSFDLRFANGALHVYEALEDEPAAAR